MKLFNSLCRLPGKSSFGSSSSFGSKIVLGLIAALVSFFINSSPAFAQTVTTTIRAVTPGQLSPAIVGVVGGRQMPVQVRVDNIINANGLGAFFYKISYDSTLISIADSDVNYIADQGVITQGNFLGSSGKQTACSEGYIDIDTNNSSRKYLSFTCGTLGISPMGPIGSGTLATINFTTGNTVASTPLTFVSTQMVNNDLDAGDIVHTNVSANVIVAKCANVDGSLDGKVLIGDILAVVNHYGTTEARYDLNGTGLVMVDDILLAVAQYSTTC